MSSKGFTRAKKCRPFDKFNGIVMALEKCITFRASNGSNLSSGLFAQKPHHQQSLPNAENLEMSKLNHILEDAEIAKVCFLNRLLQNCLDTTRITNRSSIFSDLNHLLH